MAVEVKVVTHQTRQHDPVFTKYPTDANLSTAHAHQDNNRGETSAPP